VITSSGPRRTAGRRRWWPNRHSLPAT
jgi:hypothetical protein